MRVFGFSLRDREVAESFKENLPEGTILRVLSVHYEFDYAEWRIVFELLGSSFVKDYSVPLPKVVHK